MKATRFAAWLIAILSLVAGVSQAAPPARWTILNLGDMAGGIGGSTALAINNRGEIAGSATASVPGGGFALHGFLWKDGVMQDMGAPPGSAMRTAEGLNDHGTVLAGDGLGGSFLWRDGVWERLTFGGFVNDLNKFEAMTGAYAPVSGRVHAFIYRNGALQDLGTLGGVQAAGRAINDRGEVAGHSTI